MPELIDDKHIQLAINSNLVSVLMLPFYKYPIHTGAVVGLLLILFAIVGSSNAVNLTDGLDGLAIMPTVLVACALGVWAMAFLGVALATASALVAKHRSASASGRAMSATATRTM